MALLAKSLLPVAPWAEEPWVAKGFVCGEGRSSGWTCVSTAAEMAPSSSRRGQEIAIEFTKTLQESQMIITMITVITVAVPIMTNIYYYDKVTICLILIYELQVGLLVKPDEGVAFKVDSPGASRPLGSGDARHLLGISV